jgi:peptide/nickel transport system substrate-binding protein
MSKLNLDNRPDSDTDSDLDSHTHSHPDTSPFGAETAGFTRRSFLGLALGAGAVLTLSACGGTAGAGADAGGAGTGTGTIKWAWQMVTTWDPVTSSAGSDVHMLALAYSALTKIDDNGNAQPHLVESWKYNEDGTQVTFTLRKGLVFSDGKPLDAAAVKKSLERGRDSSTSLIAAQLANLKTVSAPDATTVVLDLLTADYQYPNLLAGKTGMVVNPAAFGNNGKSLATKPAGSGPFVMKSYTQNAKAVFTKNEKYFEADQIHAGGFELYPAAAAATVVAALQSGQYNVALLPPSQLEAAKAAGLEVQIIPSMYVAVLDVNASMAPFTDPAVIEALHYAVDREELVKVAQFGVGEVDYQPFPPGYVGYSPELKDIYKYDPEKAKSILKAAGHNGDVKVKISVYAPEGVPELLQAQLKKVGIDSDIEVLPLAEATQIIYVQHSRALAVDGFAGRESPIQAYQVLFGAEGLMNPSRQVNPELQTAIQKVAETPLDSPDYPTLLQAATATAVKTMPNTFLYTIPRVIARSKSVSELPTSRFLVNWKGVSVS